VPVGDRVKRARINGDDVPHGKRIVAQPKNGGKVAIAKIMGTFPDQFPFGKGVLADPNVPIRNQSS
jgi:hypothetical protein